MMRPQYESVVFYGSETFVTGHFRELYSQTTITKTSQVLSHTLENTGRVVGIVTEGSKTPAQEPSCDDENNQ